MIKKEKSDFSFNHTLSKLELYVEFCWTLMLIERLKNSTQMMPPNLFSLLNWVRHIDSLE